MKRSGIYAYAIALLIVIPGNGNAQEAPETSDKVTAEELAVAAVLERDPRAARRLLAEYASQRIDFLDISYVEPGDDAADGGFTVAYKWNAEASEQKVEVNKDTRRLTLRRTAWGIDIDGKYAFGDATNNTDLSTASVNFSLERGDLGKVRILSKADTDGVQDCLVLQEEMIPQPEVDGDDPAWDQYDIDAREFEASCWRDNGLDDFGKSYDKALYYGIDFHSALEGNQNFSERNFLFGLSGIFTAQPGTDSQKYNIFDLPFRLVRQGFTEDSAYVAPWPSLKLDIDQIDGSDNDIRSALTSESDFTRASAEIAFQTILVSVKSQPVRFNMSYRYFYEFSAPVEIKAANLDAFDYFAMSLRFPARMIPLIQSDDYEFYFTYTNGQLPFDISSDNAFEIGFATNISQLARLFAQ